MNNTNDNGTNPELKDAESDSSAGLEAIGAKGSSSFGPGAASDGQPGGDGQSAQGPAVPGQAPIENPSIGITPDGYVVFKIHLSKGMFFVVGYLSECQLWARNYFKQIEQHHKETQKIISPKNSWWPKFRKQ